jgi:hypothetical protein
MKKKQVKHQGRLTQTYKSTKLQVRAMMESNQSLDVKNA